MDNTSLPAGRKDQYISYISKLNAGVIATASPDRAPESAFIYLAAMPDLAIVFETLITSRKFLNLQRDPRASLVIGQEDTTLQIEGEVDEPTGILREDAMACYYKACPQNSSHKDWPGLTYLRLRPRWIRYSDYGMPWKVEEYLVKG